MSDRGHSDKESRSSLERRRAATLPLRQGRRSGADIGFSDLRGEMLRIEQVRGSSLDPALAEQLEHEGAVDLLMWRLSVGRRAARLQAQITP
jgi:hypothetical protein